MIWKFVEVAFYGKESKKTELVTFQLLSESEWQEYVDFRRRGKVPFCLAQTALQFEHHFKNHLNVPDEQIVMEVRLRHEFDCLDSETLTNLLESDADGERRIALDNLFCNLWKVAKRS
jgi:hypothetical protein